MPLKPNSLYSAAAAREAVCGPESALPPAARPAFDEGATLIFRRWTALQLAVEQGWGGHQSLAKADSMIRDVLVWFHNHKEHYADELQMDLEDMMSEDFNVELEDGSPELVSKALVELWHGCCRGDLQELQRLRAVAYGNPSAPSAAQASAPQEPAESGSSGSSDDGDSADMDTDTQPTASAGGSRRPPAQVDDDGFQVVQRRPR